MVFFAWDDFEHILTMVFNAIIKNLLVQPTFQTEHQAIFLLTKKLNISTWRLHMK